MILLGRTEYVNQLNEKWYHNLAAGIMLALPQLSSAQSSDFKTLNFVPDAYSWVLNEPSKGNTKVNKPFDEMKAEFIAALVGFDREYYVTNPDKLTQDELQKKLKTEWNKAVDSYNKKMASMSELQKDEYTNSALQQLSRTYDKDIEKMMQSLDKSSATYVALDKYVDSVNK